MKIKNILIGVLTLITFCSYAQDKKIEIITERKPDNSVNFSYVKNVPGSYTVRIELNSLENCYNNKTQENIIKYKAGNLFTLHPEDRDRGISFSYSVRYVLGNSNPKVDNDIVYALPFKTGKVIKIREASDIGETYFGSEKPMGWKSFVVYTNEPDTIYAMRRGVVVKIVDKYENDNKFNKTFTSKRNEILIEHEDGTYANYKGFDKNQIFVKLGQEVYPHTPLGKLDKFNENYRFDFNIFHFLKNLLDTKKNASLKDREYKVKY